jgi:hypothetical protein
MDETYLFHNFLLGVHFPNISWRLVVKVSAFADVEDHGSCIGKVLALGN